MSGLQRIGLCLLIGIALGVMTGDVFAGFGAAVFAWIALGIFKPARRSRSRNSGAADSDGGAGIGLFSRDDRIDNDDRWDNDSGSGNDSGWGDSGGSDSGGGDSGGGDGGGD